MSKIFAILLLCSVAASGEPIATWFSGELVMPFRDRRSLEEVHGLLSTLVPDLAPRVNWSHWRWL